MAWIKLCLLIDRLVQGNKVKIKNGNHLYFKLHCKRDSITIYIFLSSLFAWNSLDILRRPQNLKTISHFFSKLLSTVAMLKWEIFFSNFCDLLRIPELYSCIFLFAVAPRHSSQESDKRDAGSKAYIVVKNCFSNHWGERSQCIKRWIS